VSYAYEKRQFSRIPLSWSDANRTLTLGARDGSFDGMLRDRTFNIVVVSPEAAAGYTPTVSATQSIAYRGARVVTRFQ
jgi:alpha-D-xyloside xylohydrolase